VAEVDWSRLAGNLYFRRLLPTLGPRILELAEGQADDGFAATVEHVTEAVRRQSIFLHLVSLHLITVLAEAEIRCIPLKGPQLSEAVYGDIGRRLSGDVDLLVSPEQLPRAVEVVRGLGYSAPTDYVGQDNLPLLHFTLLHEREELPPVELHWRIHWYERSFACKRLLPPAVGPAGDWRPAPPDELAALLLFYARDGFVDLRLASDLSAWWDIFGAELPVNALDELLQAYPALARAIRVAARVAEKTVGLPATSIISSMPRLGLRDLMAVRLANPNPQVSRSQLSADTGFIDGLLTPLGGLGAFVRRQVLLPGEVFDEYVRNADEWRARSPLDYSLRVMARYGLTVFRMMQTPETMR
jgi:hypothetical protein